MGPRTTWPRRIQPWLNMGVVLYRCCRSQPAHLWWCQVSTRSRTRSQRLMARIQHLADPPIREAVLDIRVPGPPGVHPQELREALTSVEPFPEIQDLKQGSIAFRLSPGGEPESHSESTEVVGVRGATEDGLWIVQYRHGGMTFSRLRPYPGWDTFLDRARPFVERFIEAVRPPVVERLALRYINVFRLPNPCDPADYFVAPPSLPEALSLHVGSLVSRLTVRDPATGLQAHVAHVLQDDLQPDMMGMILDIDVFRAARLDADASRLWSDLDELRKLKNRIFFESITDRNAEIYG